MLAHFLMTLDAELPHGIGSGREIQLVLLQCYKLGPSLFKDLSTDMYGCVECYISSLDLASRTVNKILISRLCVRNFF